MFGARFDSNCVFEGLCRSDSFQLYLNIAGPPDDSATSMSHLAGESGAVKTTVAWLVSIAAADIGAQVKGKIAGGGGLAAEKPGEGGAASGDGPGDGDGDGDGVDGLGD